MVLMMKLAGFFLILLGNGLCSSDFMSEEMRKYLLSYKRLPSIFVEHFQRIQKEKGNVVKRSTTSQNSKLSNSSLYKSSDPYTHQNISTNQVFYIFPNCTDQDHISQRLSSSQNEIKLSHVTPVKMFFTGYCLNLIDMSAKEIYEIIHKELASVFQIPLCQLAIQKASCLDLLIVDVLASTKYLTLDDVNDILSNVKITLKVGKATYILEEYSTPKDRIFAYKSWDKSHSKIYFLILLSCLGFAVGLIFLAGWVCCCIEQLSKRREKRRSYSDFLEAFIERHHSEVLETVVEEKIEPKPNKFVSFQPVRETQDQDTDDSVDDFTSEDEEDSLNNYNVLLGLETSAGRISQGPTTRVHSQDLNSASGHQRKVADQQIPNLATRVRFDEQVNPSFRVETDL